MRSQILFPIQTVGSDHRIQKAVSSAHFVFDDANTVTVCKYHVTDTKMRRSRRDNASSDNLITYVS